jgi:hypothetical protein
MLRFQALPQQLHLFTSALPIHQPRPWAVSHGKCSTSSRNRVPTGGSERMEHGAWLVRAPPSLPHVCFGLRPPRSSSVLLLFFSRPRPDSRDRIMCRNLIHNEQEKTSGWHRVIFLGVLDNKPPKNKRNRNFCSLFLVGVKTEIPHRPSFVSGKIWETMKNCSSQKWYGNKKILMEMEMKMIVALYR